MDEDKKISIALREVETLPEEAIEGEVILNKSDGCFYMGVNTEKEETDGSNVEETSV